MLPVCVDARPARILTSVRGVRFFANPCRITLHLGALKQKTKENDSSSDDRAIVVQYKIIDEPGLSHPQCTGQ